MPQYTDNCKRAGTGLLGQSLSNGVILDFSKHMDNLVEIENDYVIVQPGIVKGILDKSSKRITNSCHLIRPATTTAH